MDTKYPVPIRASKVNIWAHAEKVAGALSFSPGDLIEPVVARLGGVIDYRNAAIGEARPEAIVVRSPRSFTIYLSTMTSPARDRFTISHELGHLFLHYPRVAREYPGAIMVATRWVDDADPDQQRAEWEANWFAAAFLMPERAFRAALITNSIQDTAELFGVSARAAEVRAKSLGLSVD